MLESERVRILTWITTHQREARRLEQVAVELLGWRADEVRGLRAGEETAERMRTELHQMGER